MGSPMPEPLLIAASIVLLLLGNGFFSGGEIAIISARRGSIERLAAQGSRAASRVREMQDNMDRFLATVQIGVTVCAHAYEDLVELESNQGVTLVQSRIGAGEEKTRPVNGLNLLVLLVHPATEFLLETALDQEMKQVEVLDTGGREEESTTEGAAFFWAHLRIPEGSGDLTTDRVVGCG